MSRGQVALNTPIKTIGLHTVPIALHPEIEVTITINVARSADEAERIARGEDVIARREERVVIATGDMVDEVFENPPPAELEGADTESPAAEQ